MRLMRIKVNAYEKALVFKNGQLIRVLDTGRYWISPWHKVVKFDITELFHHEIDLDLLLRCKDLEERLNVVDVSDHEIVIQYKSGNFHQVLAPGRYPFWSDGVSYTYERMNMNDIEVNQNVSRIVLHKPEVQKYVTVHVVENHEKAILYVSGEIHKELTPGLYYLWKNEKHAMVAKVDVRRQQIEISGQELLTADKAAIRMSLFASYQVVDIFKALAASKDYSRQLYITLQLGLREYVGQYTLDQLLRNKSAIAPFILKFAKAHAHELGVNLIDCGIRDIILPGDIKEIMNHVLVAEKKAQANTIMRREETASTRSLLNTAKLMEDNEMLFKLKEMEYLERFADKIGEITVNGGSRVVDELRTLISSK